MPAAPTSAGRTANAEELAWSWAGLGLLGRVLGGEGAQCYRDPMLLSRGFSKSFLSAGAGLLAWFALVGCGGGGHSDTGYGKEQSVPNTVNCADLCRRTADCAGHLCAEDTGKDGYIDASAAVESQCKSTCTESELTSNATSTTWTCLFKSSCRQVFDDDACDVKATYYCR
jgi:hypothetical protein